MKQSLSETLELLADKKHKNASLRESIEQKKVAAKPNEIVKK